jgi:hypothetical protein
MARASRQHRAVAAAVFGERRSPARSAGQRSRRDHPRRVRKAAEPAHENRIIQPGIERPRHDHAAREMVEMAHRHGARVLVDGAQAVSHMRTDVQALDCDFYVFSGHKVFGPTGIGVVYGKARRARRNPAVARRRQHDCGRHFREDHLPDQLRGGLKRAPATSRTRSDSAPRSTMSNRSAWKALPPTSTSC